MAKKLQTDYCLEVNFKKGTESPSRVFHAMHEIIDAFQVLDEHLVRSIDIKIEPVLLLEDIESGSVRTWIATNLRAIPDDAIYHLDWKRFVGYYLVRGKYTIINFLEGTTTITNIDQISPLRDDLRILAEETGVRMLPDYKQIEPRLLLGDISNISSGLSYLSTDDKATYITREDKVGFNLEFKLSPESIEELFVQEVLTQENMLIMKVKKADFLGDSMWEFRFGDRNIVVKISDKEWLEKFQTNRIIIQPGDAIKGLVTISHKYDAEHNLVGYSFDLSSVVEVIRTLQSEQTDMFGNDINNQGG
ncbi:hypothetical protein ACFLVK_02190 [Chloroflexota bacterium]